MNAVKLIDEDKKDQEQVLSEFKITEEDINEYKEKKKKR